MNNERDPLRDVLTTDLPDAAEKETAKSYAEQAEAAAKRAEDAAVGAGVKTKEGGEIFGCTEGTYANTATAEFAHAEGMSCSATGKNSHAEGVRGRANGETSHAEGSYCTADGKNSHAEGENTTAKGDNSHAEGHWSTAEGYASHAEGDCSKAKGDYSHTEGDGCEAKGKYSHAEGYYTLAGSQMQHVAGKYNVEDTEGIYARITGGGTGEARPKNIETLDWEGNLILGGNVTTGAGNDLDAVAAALAALETRTQALENK